MINKINTCINKVNIDIDFVNVSFVNTPKNWRLCNWGDALGYGFRVPWMVISPFAYANDNLSNPHVSHAQVEFASVLRFAEEIFNLPSLGKRDTTAGDLSAMLNFNVTLPAVPLTQRTCPAATPTVTSDSQIDD